MSQVPLVTYNKDKKIANFKRGYVAIGSCDIGGVSQVGIVT